MSALARLKRELRERSEHYLMREVTREMGRGVPGTVAPYGSRDGLLWRKLFVPLYRRLPWELKQRAMRTLRMTAAGWTEPERRARDPWRPPPR